MSPGSLVRNLLRPAWHWLDRTANGLPPVAPHWQALKWRLRYLSGFGRDGVPSMESLLRFPHRPVLCRAVLSLGPATTILEVGSGRGANLVHLARAAPDVELLGVDISRSAVEASRRELARRGISRVRLGVAGATDLSAYRDASADIVFSDSVLMYVSPNEVTRAIREMLRVARRAILISCWHRDLPDPTRASVPDAGEWIHDFGRLIRPLGPWPVRIEPYPAGIWSDERWKSFGSLISVRLDGRDT